MTPEKLYDLHLSLTSIRVASCLVGKINNICTTDEIAEAIIEPVSRSVDYLHQKRKIGLVKNRLDHLRKALYLAGVSDQTIYNIWGSGDSILTDTRERGVWTDIPFEYQYEMGGWSHDDLRVLHQCKVGKSKYTLIRRLTPQEYKVLWFLSGNGDGNRGDYFTIRKINRFRTRTLDRNSELTSVITLIHRMNAGLKDTRFRIESNNDGKGYRIAERMEEFTNDFSE